MIYVVVALKPEAQAFVDRFKLKKTSLKNYTLFYGDGMKLIVSGVGVTNSMLATQTLINEYDVEEDDVFLNVGICGSNKEIGELLEVGSVVYDGREYILHSYIDTKLECCNTPSTNSVFDGADMESFGFYEAIRHSPAIKNFYIFKVVSDHFQPNSFSKDFVKNIIFLKIDEMFKFTKT